LQVFKIEDRSLIYEENNNTGSNASQEQEKNINTLPPLTNQFDNLTLQTKAYRLQNPKERQRSLSGQSANNTRNGKFSLKNQRSASVDYSNTNNLFKADSRSSSFASGRYSQLNGTLSSPSVEVHSKPNSVHSAFSLNRRKPNSIHRSFTMSDMLEASKMSKTENLSPDDAVKSGRKSNYGLRSSNVYSPISVASADKSKTSPKPNITRRRASLPTSTLALSNLTCETSRSREFFEALHEMKRETPRKDPG